ncbi:hypothetical protein AMATHDRAFT_134993 [Amanita thiersii Skay4041]|uniref:RNA-dependent RNA polymerase n=1 Tax=Amanita thiersii Skay4041 TaxID=703135 RepID=A0A2A9NVP4_9AGAR|nr:hypothetical protein AMATHDRAFT_134993 [Amanita thiersii Skay4041]
MQDVADFVLEFINSDVVGIIAIHWLIIADQSDNGIHDPDCMQLAQLHSDAVDYPKSGQPVKHGRIPKLKFRERPDWIAPETAKEESGNYYQSRKALGQLFRSIKLPEVEEYTRPKRSRRRRHPVREHLQEYEREDNLDIQDYSGDIIDLEVNLLREEYLGNRTWVSEATQDMIKQIYPRYVNELRAICTNYSLSHSWTSRLTEEEVFIGTIMAKTSQPRKRKEMISKLREQTDLLVRGVKEELLFGDQDIPPEELLERACIAWHLASEGGMVFGAQSFRWIALGSVFEAVKEIDAAHEMDARDRFY